MHPEPASALSDAAQQLTPQQLLAMVHGLNLPKEEGGNADFLSRMSELRDHVDELDSGLLDLLAQRMEIVREMGQLKAKQNVSTLQPHRWQEIVEDRLKGLGYL